MNRQRLTGWVESIILVGIMWLLTKMMKLIILILKIKFGREGIFFKTFSGSNERCVAWQTVAKQFYDGFNWFSLWFAMVLTLSFRSDAKKIAIASDKWKSKNSDTAEDYKHPKKTWKSRSRDSEESLRHFTTKHPDTAEDNISNKIRDTFSEPPLNTRFGKAILLA